MKPYIGYFASTIEAEIIYSFIIIVCSLMVYFGTKKLYDLSSHKGIKYFRQAFLFFAIAYFFRSLIKFLLIFFNLREILDFSPRVFGPFTLLLFMYFSSLAIFYLVYSATWKRWKRNSKNIYLFHILAFLISLITITLRSFQVYLYLNLLLFIFIVFIILIVRKSSKKKHHHLYIVYLLLLIFWILNIFDILVPRFLQKFHLLLYLSSITIFLLILYKVLKKTGTD